MAWKRLSQAARRSTLAVAGLIGVAVGVIGWGGFNTVMEATNATAFCISCHEMRDNVYQEYRQTAHYSNPSGVRAECADCHVPRDRTHKLLRKAAATAEVYHWLVGSIDTPEKFAAKRHELAQREWARMRASDSRECRNCHSYEAMNFHKQTPKAAKAMRDAAAAGKTCIDCHKGIAHTFPDVAAGHRRQFAQMSASATAPPPSGGVAFPLTARPFRLQPPAATDGADGAVDGEIFAATPVRVLAVENGAALVEVTGWRREGSAETLFARQGRRVTAATLGADASKAAETLRAVEDPDTGMIWSETRLRGWTAAAGYVDDAEKLWDYGGRMYGDNCGLCHALHPPQRYTADAWIGHVNAMKRTTPLDEAEVRLLLTYLQNHAKDVASDVSRR